MNTPIKRSKSPAPLHTVVGLLAVAAVLSIGLISTGCEVSHTETDKQGILGGHTHEETTTTRNPVTGDTSTTHTEVKTP